MLQTVCASNIANSGEWRRQIKRERAKSDTDTEQVTRTVSWTDTRTRNQAVTRIGLAGQFVRVTPSKTQFLGF